MASDTGMSKKNKKIEQNSHPVARSSRRRWIVGGVLVVVALGLLALLPPKGKRGSPPDSKDSTDNAAKPAADDRTVAKSTAEPGNHQRLIGRWLRPDGGYILEIKSATAEGKLDARYLNPRSIHVARAEWRREEGNLQVFVELRDENYPGSTYHLEYSAAEDRMAGNYYQAAQQEDFAVEFVRESSVSRSDSRR